MNKKPLLILLVTLVSIIAIVSINSVYSYTTAWNNWIECNGTTGWYYTWVVTESSETHGFSSDSTWYMVESGSGSRTPYGAYYLSSANSGIRENASFPIYYNYTINKLNVHVSDDFFCFWAGVMNSSSNGISGFAYTGDVNSNMGVFWDFSKTNGLRLRSNNGTTYTLYSQAYTTDAQVNITLYMIETAYNQFNILGYINGSLVYNGTDTIVFNSYIIPYCVGYGKTASYTSGYWHTSSFRWQFSHSVSNPIDGTTNFRIFSGFVGTVIDWGWVTLQSLATYISSITTYIYSGVQQVIATLSMYITSIWGVVSQTTINFIVGLKTYISQATVYLIMGYRNGIAWISINITQPLKTGISYIVTIIKTGISNGISTISIYIYNGAINFISMVQIFINSLYETNPPTPVLFIAMNYLIFLLVLLIPTYALYNYVGSIAVIPTLDLMSIVCYISGLCNFGIMLIILIVSIGVLFRSRIRERFN